MEKKKTLAGRLSRKFTLWMLVILAGLSFVVFYYTRKTASNVYSENYYSRMLVNKEYTQRVLSDVYVAITNNIYYIEQELDNPDSHKELMKRIVKSGTRIRSCGVSFVEDYYPEKGHHFCPYAWKSPVHPDVVEAVDMGDTALDYLDAEWFRNVIEADSAYWSEPFFDGNDKKTPLTAYMVPIHNTEGRVVAVLGADVSLDWLTNKLNETDSIVGANASFASDFTEERSHSFIINHDGIFITHPDSERILKDNFFYHINNDEDDEEGLEEIIKRDDASDEEKGVRCLFDGQECYIFFTPVKYTNWTMVTVVPWQSIDTVGIFNGAMLIILLILVVILAAVVYYYLIRNEVLQLKQLAKVTDDIAKGQFYTPIPQSRHNDEIGQLCDSMENMQYRLFQYVNEKKAEETPTK